MRKHTRILRGLNGVLAYLSNVVGALFAIWLLFSSDFSIVTKTILVVGSVIIFTLNYIEYEEVGGERNHDED